MDVEYFQLQLQGPVQVALPLSASVEVLTLAPQQICAIPEVDPALLGVSNWRGKLLWNVNLSKLLGVREGNSGMARPRPQSSLTAIVIAQEQPGRQLACVVSELKGLVPIATEQIKPVPSRLPPTLRGYLRGVIQLEAPLILLNPAAILNSPRWRSL